MELQNDIYETFSASNQYYDNMLTMHTVYFNEINDLYSYNIYFSQNH